MFKELMTDSDKKRFARYIGPLDEDGCRPWLSSTVSVNDPRGQFHIQGKNYLAHRIQHSLTHLEEIVPLDGTGELDCAHSCGIASCVSEFHTRLATRSENMQDAIRHGTISREGKCHQVLTREQVISARHLHHKLKIKVSTIAKGLGVARITLRDAVYGKSWGWLEEGLPA